jgi:membrane-associated phospholipid phosphatase
MEEHQKEQVEVISTPSRLLPVVPFTRDRKVANWVSRIGNPGVLATAGTLISARMVDLPGAWYWAGFSIILTIMAPIAYILWLLRKGKITDFDIYCREQRLGPYIFVILCGGITFAVMQVAFAPHLLAVIAGAGFAETLVMTLINLRWKISAHAAAMAGFAVLSFYLVGMLGLLFFLGIPLMIWSRVRLHRHTLAQTVVGSILGAGIFTLCLLVL